MAFLADKQALDDLTTKQWDSFFRMLARAGQPAAIRPSDFEGLYRNTLLPEMFERFAAA
jgi:hypothetical protein